MLYELVEIVDFDDEVIKYYFDDGKMLA